MNYKRPVLDIFVYLLIVYLVLFCINRLKPGFVDFYLNLSFLLYAVIVCSVISFWLYFGYFSDYVRVKPTDSKRVSEIKRLLTNKTFLLALILLACFGLRYYFAAIGDINLDEGNGLYDANLILQGKIPFKDYATRAPAYMYTLALFIKIFGYSIMTGRLVAITAGAVICFFIFLIGKELYNKKVGLIAALIYCLSPYFIYFGIIGYLRTASFVWVPILVYFLILALKNKKLKYYLFSGFFIGVAFLFYRGYLTYLILGSLALVCIHPREFKNLFRNTATVFLGFCLPAIPVLLYFVLQADILWILRQYTPPAYITTVTYTVAGIGKELPYFEAKSRELYTISRVALYLFIPALLFSSLLLKNLIKNWKVFLPVVVGIWAFVLYLVVNGRFIEWYAMVQQPMPEGYPTAFFYLLGFLSIISFLFLVIPRFSFDLKPNLKFANIFLIAWFLCASTYFIISPLSCAIGAVPATIMAAIAILAILSHWREGRLGKVLPAIFITLLTLSAIFAGFAYANTLNPDRAIKMSTAREAGQYVNERTSPDDEIFTGVSIFAVEANRRITFDISHSLAYLSSVDDPMGGHDPYDITPSITEIINYLEQHKLKYIIADPRTKAIFISERHPDLRDYILENYVIEKSIGNVDIYARKSD